VRKTLQRQQVDSQYYHVPGYTCRAKVVVPARQGGVKTEKYQGKSSTITTRQTREKKITLVQVRKQQRKIGEHTKDSGGQQIQRKDKVTGVNYR